MLFLNFSFSSFVGFSISGTVTRPVFILSSLKSVKKTKLEISIEKNIKK